MKYWLIFKMACNLFKHTIQHLLTQDIQKNDTIGADINWTISRKPKNEET